MPSVGLAEDFVYIYVSISGPDAMLGAVWFYTVRNLYDLW